MEDLKSYAVDSQGRLFQFVGSTGKHYLSTWAVVEHLGHDDCLVARWAKARPALMEEAAKERKEWEENKARDSAEMESIWREQGIL